jgi:hypothetical protein
MAKEDQDSYITHKLLLFEYFVAWEQYYFVMKQAAFDWLKLLYKVNDKYQ